MSLIVYFNVDTHSLTEWIDNLNKFDNAQDIFDSQEAYGTLAKLCTSMAYTGIIQDSIDHLIDNFNFVHILMAYYAENGSQIDLNDNIKEPLEITANHYYSSTSLTERKVYNFFMAMRIVNLALPLSVKLRASLNEKKYLKIYLDLAKNHEFLIKINSKYPDCVGSVFYNLNWISKEAENFKNFWHELNAIEILLKSAGVFSVYKIFIIMNVANVAFDKEIEHIEEIRHSIDEIVKYLHYLTSDSDGFTVMQFFEDGKSLEFRVRVAHHEDINVTISSVGILQALFRFSINPNLRLEMFEKPNFKESLRKIIMTDEEFLDIEQFYTIELLSQLCFNDQISNTLSQDKDMCNKISSFINQTNFTYKKLKHSAQQFDWILNEKKRIHQVQEIARNETEEPNVDKMHIMISYNTKSREMCLKIKEELESKNLRVWMDVTDIHGSSLDAMAKAVENSKCVLMCVSENYRQSTNCQAEAQYAFRLNKIIIPLIMQKDYHNITGWLGIIIGDKIFVDFTKYEWSDAMNRLKKQIALTTTNHVKKDETTKISTPCLKASPMKKDTDQLEIAVVQDSIVLQKQKQHYAFKWDQNEVENWFKSKNISNLFSLFVPCDGKLLYQLYCIQVNTPEFFYKSMAENQINVIQVARFGSVLKELFEKENV